MYKNTMRVEDEAPISKRKTTGLYGLSCKLVGEGSPGVSGASWSHNELLRAPSCDLQVPGASPLL